MKTQRWHFLLAAVVLISAACADSSEVVSSDEGSSSDDVATSVEVPATVGPNGEDEVEEIVVDGFSISELNNAVQEFLVDRLDKDGIQIEYSAGISLEDRESPRVVVGLPAAARQRADVASIEDDLRDFVEQLANDSDITTVDDIFSIQTAEMSLDSG